MPGIGEILGVIHVAILLMVFLRELLKKIREVTKDEIKTSICIAVDQNLMVPKVTE